MQDKTLNMYVFICNNTVTLYVFVINKTLRQWKLIFLSIFKIVSGFIEVVYANNNSNCEKSCEKKAATQTCVIVMRKKCINQNSRANQE